MKFKRNPRYNSIYSLLKKLLILIQIQLSFDINARFFNNGHIH